VAPEREAESGEVTRLLQAWGRGDATALEALWPLVYDDLRQLASRQLRRERSDHTLQKTALVNEAFMRLAGPRTFAWLNREQFMLFAAKVMRRVLVDHARRRNAQRRGDGALHLSLSDTQAQFAVDELQGEAGFDDEDVNLVAIDEALQRLEKMDAMQSQIVELRYFGGLTIEETASVTGISTASVKREWAMARAWLHRELGGA
jgi:RNA polymerase sigma factor (TIGR02999 family)